MRSIKKKWTVVLALALILALSGAPVQAGEEFCEACSVGLCIPVPDEYGFKNCREICIVVTCYCLHGAACPFWDA